MALKNCSAYCVGNELGKELGMKVGQPVKKSRQELMMPWTEMVAVMIKENEKQNLKIKRSGWIW